VKNFTALLLLILLIFSCNTEDDEENNLLPIVPVDETIFLNNPEYINLQVVGGSVETNRGGISGIIIYHYSTNTYIAFERSAPHLRPQVCSKMTVKNGIIMFCSCDDSEFNILNGAPLTDGVNYQARQYRVAIVGSNTLRITNF
jgi:nitrite reductase/ring-hydroxylating ferredoxin subunit